jgi:hypothetical protein
VAHGWCDGSSAGSAGDPPRYPTATLHEAAGQTGAPPCEIKSLVSTFRMWGPALPVTTAALDNLWIHRALLVARPGDAGVVAPSSSEPAGYWGEILSNAAVARGIGGVVIHGHCRDGETLVDVRSPVFSWGLCIQATKKDPESVGGMGEPIAPGDVVDPLGRSCRRRWRWGGRDLGISGRAGHGSCRTMGASRGGSHGISSGRCGNHGHLRVGPARQCLIILLDAPLGLNAHPGRRLDWRANEAILLATITRTDLDSAGRQMSSLVLSSGYGKM